MNAQEAEYIREIIAQRVKRLKEVKPDIDEEAETMAWYKWYADVN